MMYKLLAASALLACLTIGFASMSSADDRKEAREAAGVEAGDRVDHRSEARENVEMDTSERKEVRESAGVEAGDRVDRRKEVRETVD